MRRRHLMLLASCVAACGKAAPNAPPIAHLTADPLVPGLEVPVVFDGAGSRDENGAVVAYHIDYGDGAVPLLSASPRFVHRFRAPGAFTVSLVVIDDDGAASAPATLDVVIGGSDVPDMITIPAGPFWMGCEGCDGGDATPLHVVTLSTYLIDRTEVTRAAYGECVGAGACPPPRCDQTSGADVPAGCVRWSDAATYCAWRSKRLPTEAEWEKAARGATDTRAFPWGEAPVDCAHRHGLGCGNAPLPVDALPAGASPYGVLNLLGNAEEWTNDWFDPLYYGASPATDPPGPPSGNWKAARGGSFVSDAAGVWQRFNCDPATCVWPTVGFRCARTP